VEVRGFALGCQSQQIVDVEAEDRGPLTRRPLHEGRRIGAQRAQRRQPRRERFGVGLIVRAR
jgi:hypothetical protein